MRTRHMMALLLGVAPIVAIGQLATAQTMNHAGMNHQGMNHQGMDHSTMNHAAMAPATPAPNASEQAAEATNAVDATPNATAAPLNTSDDVPPK